MSRSEAAEAAPPLSAAPASNGAVSSRRARRGTSHACAARAASAASAPLPLSSSASARRQRAATPSGPRGASPSAAVSSSKAASSSPRAAAAAATRSAAAAARIRQSCRTSAADTGARTTSSPSDTVPAVAATGGSAQISVSEIVTCGASAVTAPSPPRSSASGRLAAAAVAAARSLGSMATSSGVRSGTVTGAPEGCGGAAAWRGGAAGRRGAIIVKASRFVNALAPPLATAALTDAATASNSSLWEDTTALAVSRPLPSATSASASPTTAAALLAPRHSSRATSAGAALADSYKDAGKPPALTKLPDSAWRSRNPARSRPGAASGGGASCQTEAGWAAPVRCPASGARRPAAAVTHAFCNAGRCSRT
eukprot:scaffold20040_cov60-Phaeocystis_antarctica.AAC.5